MIVYYRLWKTMEDRGVTQYSLINKYNISPAQLTRLRHNESVSTNTIDTFCRILDCELDDILERVEDTPEYLESLKNNMDDDDIE